PLPEPTGRRSLRFIRTREKVVEEQRSRPPRAERHLHGTSRLVTALEKCGGEVRGQSLSRLQRFVQPMDGVRDLAQGERLLADQYRRHAEVVALFRLSEPPNKVLRDRAQPVGNEQEITAHVMSRLERVEDVG